MAPPGRLRDILVMLVLAGAVSACTATLDPGQDAASKAVFEQARRHDFAAIEARLPPAARTAVTDARIQAQAALIPDQPPVLIKLVEVRNGPVDGARRIQTTREYFYTDRLLVVTTLISETPGKPMQVLGFHVQPFARTALAASRFELTGKSSIQYFLLSLAVLIPLLMAAAALRLVQDRTVRLKWVWALFILIGFTRVSVNWTTGTLLFQPLGLLLLGAAVGRGPLDVSPWTVTVSLPVGAMAYLARTWFRAPPDEMN